MTNSFSDLMGKTLLTMDGVKGENCIKFQCSDGSIYELYHDQDCCESVLVEDICGNVKDILEQQIILAEEVSSGDPEGWKPGSNTESYTWTFYKIVTNKGYITIRWFGESNGYYSEAVSFRKLI